MLEHSPDASSRVRLRDRLHPPPAPPPAVLTGHEHRVPVPFPVQVPDPVSGAAVEMVVWDHPARPGARTIVTVHGFRGDRHGLALLADLLPELHVVAVDLPGFGASAPYPDAEHTTAAHARALTCAVRALRLPEPPVVVAHSYGTVVAAHAVAAGLHVPALALLNPIAEPALDASGSGTARALAGLARGYYALAAALPDRAARAVLGAPPVVWATTTAMSRTRDRRVLGYTHDQHRRHFSGFASPAMLRQAYLASTTGTVREVAAALDLPVLLVAGRDDPLGSPTVQHELADAIAAAGGTPELHVLDGVGHLLHYERPVECAALIRSWLPAR